MPKGRILAVDDQRYFRELIEGMLAEEGFDAQTAASGEEALRLLEHSAFDIVLTDLVMPGMDGSELVHRIKERDPDQDIVVVTGVVDVKTAVEAMKLGATDYLLKPFDRKTLGASFEAVLQRRRLRAEHARLLAENIEYLSERSLFERAIGLFAHLSVGPLAEKMIEGLCLETRAQGGVLWIAGEDESEALQLAAARGLVRLNEEPEILAAEDLAPEIRDGSTRSLFQEWGDGGPGVRPALYLPLRREGRVIGLVRLTDRLDGDEFDTVDRACAEKLAGFAGTALVNALRFRSLERRSLKELGTGAYIFEYFRDVVRNEIEKASRFGRSFSLLKLDLGPLDDLQRLGGRAAVDQWRAGVTEDLGRLLRTTDLLAAEGDRWLYALLPEADALGAAVLKQRAREDIERSDALMGIEPSVRPRPRLGVATYPGDGTQLESLMRALDSRVEEDRRSPVAALELDSISFAENLDALLAEGEAERPQTAQQITRFMLGEVGRRPRERGLLFVAPGEALAGALRDGLESLHGISTRTEIVVVGSGERPAFADSAVTWVPSELATGSRPFLIHFGDGPAYALVSDDGPSEDGARLFHTSQRSLIEYLALRLQSELSVPLAIWPHPEERA
jgi:diguanylate cyclase (GGDEF)-like protein